LSSGLTPTSIAPATADHTVVDHTTAIHH
jgi:hypothetical protein